MKKIKTLFVALSSAALLASCGGARAEFKEFLYKRVLSNGEKGALIEKIKSITFAKLNKYEYESYDEYTKLIDNHTVENKYVYNFYKNGEMEWESTNKQVGEVDGKTQKSEFHTKAYRALIDEENLKYASGYEYDEDNRYAYNEQFIDAAESFAMNELESAILFLMDSSMKAVEDKNGNIFFIYSNVQETNSLQTYGNSKKNFHRIQKQQRVGELNKDLTIKQLTYVISVEQNRDPDTNEFYKKTKQVQLNTESYKFYYGEKSDASAKVVELRQKAKEGYRLAPANPTVKGKAFKEDGTQLGAYNFVVEQNKQFEFGKRHYVARCYNLVPHLGEDVSTVKLQVSGQSVSNAVADPVAFDLEVPIASLGAGNSGLSLVDGGAIKLGKHNINIKIEFDLEATAQGAVASNVAAYATLSFLS